MCGADRAAGEQGACGAGGISFVARAARHYYEEPPVSGTNGSGAVFFTGCNMRCVFCQNIDISTAGQSGVPGSFPVTADALADIMLRLQKLGSHNINLVTPTPHIDLLTEAIPLAKSRGLTIPIVYNTNGYERAESLKRLEGLVDVYLPDFKYVSPRLAQKFSGREDYFTFAAPAVCEMQRQVGTLVCDESGVAVRGLIVRHLVLPAAVDETRRVLSYLHDTLPEDTYISLMSQYTPIPGMQKPLDRRLTRAEYKRAVDYALSLGFTNLFIQKLSSASLDFTPEFNGFVE